MVREKIKLFCVHTKLSLNYILKFTVLWSDYGLTEHL